MLAAGKFKGRTTSRDDNTTGSEDVSVTGSRNRDLRGGGGEAGEEDCAGRNG